MSKIKIAFETPKGKIIHIATKGGKITAKIEWNPGFGEKMGKRFMSTQEYIDSEVLRLSGPYVPFLTGTLEKSGPLSTEVGSGVVVWGVPYAAKQYYTNAGHSGGRRGKLWFERMKADHKDSIIAGAAKLAGGKKA